MKTILIVDDDPLIRESTQTYLEMQGFGTVCAENGKDAMIKSQEETIHLALVDIFMPNQGGFEFIMSLSQKFPIIAMSGVSSHRFEPLAFAESLGADASLTKPFHPNEMMKTIHRLLQITD